MNLLNSKTFVLAFASIGVLSNSLVAGGCSGQITLNDTTLDGGDDAAGSGEISRPTARRDGGSKEGAFDAGLPWEQSPTLGETGELIILDAGTVAPGEAARFTIEQGTLGFVVIATPQSGGDSSLGIRRIESPKGNAVHDNFTPYNGKHETSFTRDGDVVAAAVPQSNHPDAMQVVQPGEWKVTLAGLQPATVSVRVQKTRDGAFHGGLVDLHLYLPEGLEMDRVVLDVTQPKTLEPIRARIDVFARVIQQLYGLTRGSVTFHTIDAKYLEIDEGELSDAFSESRAGAERALHIVFSQANRGQQWWGIAGGIPGAATVRGTGASGIALAHINIAEASAEGFVLAHEMGHFFGLNHTSEFDNAGFDPLEDTGECPTATVGRLDQCPDRKNIMMAAGPITNPVETSPLQRRVVQGSPIFRALLQDNKKGNSFDPGLRVDWGGMFGHRGRALSSAEAMVLASLCGSGLPRNLSISPPPPNVVRDLAAVASNAELDPVLRNAAKRLIDRAPR